MCAAITGVMEGVLFKGVGAIGICTQESTLLEADEPGSG